MQKEDFMHVKPTFLVVVKASLLENPNLLKHNVTDLEQYPLAPTSMANRSAPQPLDVIVFTRHVYFASLVECQRSMFSSQGQVSSTKTTLFNELENITISGLKDV